MFCLKLNTSPIKLSLETGALKVGREPERLRHGMRGIHGNPTSGNHPCMQLSTGTVTLKDFSGKYSPDPILTNALKGRDGPGARIRKDSLRQQICIDQLKNASMRCNVSHKISNRPLPSPHRSRMLEEEIADCWLAISLCLNYI